MEIKVTQAGFTRNAEVEISENNATINTGLLDQNDQTNLAKDMLYAAYELVHNIHPEQSDAIYEVINDLEET